MSKFDVAVSETGACLAVFGTPSAWASIKEKSLQTGSLVLFPAIHRRRTATFRQLLRFLRLCVSNEASSAEMQLEYQLASIVGDLQSGFTEMIDRCPGMSLTRKKAVFLRLQRVRNHIAINAHEDVDVSALALMASYSVCHFITIFRSVYGQTPYRAVNHHRLGSASELLIGSTLAIGDVAHSIGFQSRSSFNRAVKRNMGMSATDLRAKGANWKVVAER